MNATPVEIWADSFHEGEWFVESLLGSTYAIEAKSYRFNFQPRYTIVDRADNVAFDVMVYGDYGGWTNRPLAVDRLLEVGKPDVMMVDPAADVVLLAVEETNAVPTGNQALQRLERVWWAAESRVPFVYLLGEFGLHVDGGVRRNSIWPAYLGIKLSLQYRTPSLTAMYGSRTAPNDYALGQGLQLTADVASHTLARWGGLSWATDEAWLELLKTAYLDMGRFILTQADDIAPLLPAKTRLIEDAFVELLASSVAGAAL